MLPGPRKKLSNSVKFKKIDEFWTPAFLKPCHLISDSSNLTHQDPTTQCGSRIYWIKLQLVTAPIVPCWLSHSLRPAGQNPLWIPRTPGWFGKGWRIVFDFLFGQVWSGGFLWGFCPGTICLVFATSSELELVILQGFCYMFSMFKESKQRSCMRVSFRVSLGFHIGFLYGFI